jgi:hypothetical protein
MLSACAFEGKIYAIGGTTEDWENVFYKVVEVYDPLTNSWTKKADMPTGRWGHISCVINGLIYTIDGRSGPTSSKMNEVYDPVLDIWITKAPLQQARTGLAGGVINNRIYAVGGHNGPPIVFLSSCEEYVIDLVNAKSESEVITDKNELFQNYPNPFNPYTIIKYSVPNQSKVTLKVFDLLGCEEASLVNYEQPKGNYEVDFDGSNLTSGIYFYRLQTGDFIKIKKMILQK